MEKLINDIKELIIESLALEDMSTDEIETSEPLFNEGLGLDSIDALELGVAIKNKYQISVKDENEAIVQCILESVFSKRQFILDWQDLKQEAHWLMGWK